MALSNVVTNGDGVTTNFAVPFQYLDRSHVHVYVSGVEKTFTWLTGASIQVSPAPPAGTQNVEIRRVTPRDAPVVDYSNGSVLAESDLDKTSLQTLFISQEYFEQTENFFPAGHSLDSHTDSTPAESTAKGAMRVYDNTSKTRAVVATDGGILRGDAIDSKGVGFLPIGTQGQVLEVDTAVAGKMAWKTDTIRSILTTKGDLMTYQSGPLPTRLPTGSDGQILASYPAAATGLQWLNGVMDSKYMINGLIQVIVNGPVANGLRISLLTNSFAAPSVADPVWVPIRSVTGVVALRKVTSAVTMDVPAGATLGTLDATPSRIYVGVMDTGSAIELYVVNPVREEPPGSTEFLALQSPSEAYPISTAAVGTGSDSFHVSYSTIARGGLSHRLVAYFDSTQPVAGTWNSATTVQMQLGPGVPRTGDIVSTIYSRNGNYATASGAGTIIPYDNSVPQSTEGVALMTVGILPLASANLLRVNARAFLAANGAEFLQLALFRNGVSNSLVTTIHHATTGDSPRGLEVHKLVRANQTSLVDFTARGGLSGANIIYFNGISSGGRYGGNAASHITIEEIQA